MEDHRDQSSNALIEPGFRGKRNRLLPEVLIFAGLSLIFFLLTLLLPTLVSSSVYQKSLRQLRNKSLDAKNAFNLIQEGFEDKYQLLETASFPTDQTEIFSRMKKTPLVPEYEGIGYTDGNGQLLLWLGNVIDLENIFFADSRSPLFEEHTSPLLIRDKASVQFVSYRKLDSGSYIVLFRLLAFLPQFRSSYLQDSHFLPPKLMKNCNLDYWDFREDVSGFEKIFLKHQDSYIGQPRLQGEVQTLFFPLRDVHERIIATVTLSSPSLSARLSKRRDVTLLLGYLSLITALVLLIILFISSPRFQNNSKAVCGLIILLLIGLRALFLPLSKLIWIHRLDIFSPAKAGFLSLGGLTKSPGDIFFSSLFLLLIIGCFYHFINHAVSSQKTSLSGGKALAFQIPAIVLSFGLTECVRIFIDRIVQNSNLNLLHFTFEPSLLLLHTSIIFLTLVAFMLSFLILKSASRRAPRRIPGPLLLLAAIGGFFLLIFPRYILIPHFIIQLGITGVILILSIYPEWISKKRILISAFTLMILFVTMSFHSSAEVKKRSLLNNSLKTIILSQEDWGRFLLEQSLMEIDKSDDIITRFITESEPSDLAQSLWGRTWLARFNWYSSLEFLSPDKVILTRFSLNIPEFYRVDIDLPETTEWVIFPQSIPAMGSEKNFLIAYKDWTVNGLPGGRMILYLNIDYDMLPFLYSANPYFESMRTASLPSLNQFNLGVAVYDSNGKLIFNPDKISTGIPVEIFGALSSGQDIQWSEFSERRKNFSCLYIWHHDRIYALFYPQKNLIGMSVEFLKVFCLYAFFLLAMGVAALILSRKNRIKNPFWSFANRLYISFIVIAVVPLLLFTFSSRNIFTQIFSLQITDKAESQAEFTQRVMEDFIFLQQEDQVALTLPPDTIVSWISSTISNDVNLFGEGRLITSSRRELFDNGLLPELIDGEIFYKIQFENNPFYTQTQNIGDYSFHTLTIPFFLEETLYLISLPFPLEEQELSQALEELIDFLFLITVVFIIAVLLLARGIGDMLVIPIKNLLLGIKEVGLGNLEISIPYPHNDEMTTLIEGFNTMVKNLKRHQQDMADMSKKAAWAEMARKVAHEVKNPLTPIQLSAEHLLKVYADNKENFAEALEESTSYIIKEVDNLRKIAQDFLETSKETTLHKDRMDLKALIQETIEPYKKLLADRIQFLESYAGEDFILLGDRAKISIALRNIITNAIESIQETGRIEVHLRSEPEFIRCEIKDNGAGIEQAILTRIFDPYFSTKDSGTGLGLPIVKRIVVEHNGMIEASGAPGRGVTISITLPRNQTDFIQEQG